MLNSFENVVITVFYSKGILLFNNFILFYLKNFTYLNNTIMSYFINKLLWVRVLCVKI